MTGVAAEVTVTEPNAGVPEGPIPDDLLSEALTAAAERNSRFLPDDPTPAPEPAAADKPKAEDGAGNSTKEGEVPAAPDPNAPPAPADKPADETWETQWAALVKDAVPLAYRQDEQVRAFGHILEVPGKGGFIPADKLDEVRNLVARHESNAVAVKDLYSYKQEVEGLGGPAKLHELTAANAQLDAAAVLILESLRHPLQFVQVDAQGNVVPNQERINFLIERAGIAAERAKFSAQAETQKLLADHTQKARETETEAQVRATALPTALKLFRDEYKDVLTDADFKEAEKVFGPLAARLVSQLTPEQARQWNMAPGQLVVDRNPMAPWFESRAAFRTQQASEAKARAAAAKENASRQPPAKPAPRKPAPSQPRDAEGKFVPPKRPDASTIFERAMAGKPVSGAEDYDL